MTQRRWKTTCYWVTALALIALGGVDGLGQNKPPLTGKTTVTEQGAHALPGKWGPVMPWPVNAVHVSLLPTGKVLLWPRGALSKPVGPKGEAAPEAICYPRLWDPKTHKFTVPPRPPFNIFCSGHCFLSDGRLFVAGGHIKDNVGEPRACIYDPVKNTWAETPRMNAGRWYPSCLSLPDGGVLAIAGDISGGTDNLVPQVFVVGGGSLKLNNLGRPSHPTSHWRSLTGAQGAVEDYPFLHVAPNGKVFLAGRLLQTKYLDTSGNGQWTVVGDRAYKEQRPYGSSVMYEPGKVLVLGGNEPPLKTAEIIDLTKSKPRWQKTDSMYYGRIMQNATLLADGTVFVSGGSSTRGLYGAAAPVLIPELWDPKTGHWLKMAAEHERRLYHSTAILLPDGTVLSAGGGEPDGGEADRPIDLIQAPSYYTNLNAHRNAQVFSPPYLFRGPRPVITSAPPSVAYGHKFVVLTPDWKKIKKVTLVRLSSTTHAQNFNQRFNKLDFQLPGTAVHVKGPPGSIVVPSTTKPGLSLTALTVTAPPNRNVAPPGHYLLFLLNDQGVPSVAKIIHLG